MSIKKPNEKKKLEDEQARAGVPCFNCDHLRGEHSFLLNGQPTKGICKLCTCDQFETRGYL